MRVLILNGSPRPKGNTKQLIQAFCEGLETAGHEYGVYDVCKMNIHGCLACEYCHTKGNGQCVQKDDMQYVYHELQEAEMLVIASPIYYHGLSGQLKCVIDRKDPNASVDAGYGHAIALIMSNAACRTGNKATFDAQKRQVMVDGKVWTGYASTACQQG